MSVVAIEYRRFSLDSVNRGHATGWTFASGWFPFQTTYFAWFRREVVDG